MKQLLFQVAEFDAPLDLILHLISRHKLNIADIDISSLLEQYMETIRSWQQQDMEVASAFLEMASRLVYMKTASLLPRHKEESELLRRNFAGELMEYRACKEAAGILRESNQQADSFGRPATRIETDPLYTYTHPATDLFAALCDAMGKGARRRPPDTAQFETIMERPVVSVTERIFSVLRQLRKDRLVQLDKLFAASPSRSGMVATFLAVLELIKAGRIEMKKDHVQMKRRAS
jgi:Uncharacterized conserved protein